MGPGVRKSQPYICRLDKRDFITKPMHLLAKLLALALCNCGFYHSWKQITNCLAGLSQILWLKQVLFVDEPYCAFSDIQRAHVTWNRRGKRLFGWSSYHQADGHLKPRPHEFVSSFWCLFEGSLVVESLSWHCGSLPQKKPTAQMISPVRKIPLHSGEQCWLHSCALRSAPTLLLFTVGEGEKGG